MKQYINETIQVIRNQIMPNQTNIICIEGIDTPVIYKEICIYFKSHYPDLTFIAKVTKEKYNQFISEGKETWQNALSYLSQNNFVDTDGAMTRWRNNAADIGTDDKTTLVLLMGTEFAPDKGGLQDFFHITPDDIIRNLSKDYSKWFTAIFEICALNIEEKKAINTLFKIIFYEINIDLIKFSNFIDSVMDLHFDTTQDLVNYICENMNMVWGIPPIKSIKAVPSVRNLCNGRLKDGKIISDAYGFINRIDGILSKAQIEKTKKKLARYMEKNSIIENQPFPTDTEQFESYAYFGKCLVDFLCGKNVDDNRNKFLYLDYTIVDSILNTKLEKTKEKFTVPTIIGEPIEVYIEMLTSSIKTHFDLHKRLPEKAIVKITQVRLSNCTIDDNSTSEEADTLEVAFANMCCFLGGIVDFLNNSEIENSDGNLLEIRYDGDFDPFMPDNFSLVQDSIDIGVTKRFNELCRIEFIIKVFDDEQESKYEYKWLFPPQNAWKNSFSLLNSLVKGESDTFEIPTLLSCDNIPEYLSCENEEFYTKLEQIKISNLHDEHRSEILKRFNGNNIIQQFESLLVSFYEWAVELCNSGLYNSLPMLHKLVQKYDDFMKYINSDIGSFTSTQKESLHIFLNTFLIVSDRKVIETGDVKEAIVPVYHPVMLEKIAAKMTFLQQGLSELVSDLLTRKSNFTNIKTKLAKLVELSSITLATDTILSKNNNYLMCQNVWNYYGIYYDENISNAIISGGTYCGILIDEDNEDKGAMLKTSPESNIVFRNLIDYIKTFPARVDGLNICFIAPIDMQHIVAGVHSIAKRLEDNNVSAVINIRIICLDSQKNSSSYLRYWLDNYFGEERAVKVNTYLKYVSLVGTSVDSLDRFLDNQDICFIYNILTPSQIKFKKSEREQSDINQSKFPMTFAPDTISKTQGKRNVNISQFQFLASKSHTQVTHAVGNANDEKGVYKVMRILEMQETQEKITDKAHKFCKWVVCIDEAIDRYILQNENRKIIGFTTGEGCYGELNVTVSAREDILSDIKAMLKRRIIEKFKNWGDERLEQSAQFCVDIAKDLDGSRILRALNPYDYEIHNYLAYVLTLQMLRIPESDNRYLVRNLINLDSYKHWFSGDFEERIEESESRPDFMLLEILNDEENVSPNSKLNIKISVIECKMGMNNPSQIEKAKTQLEHGIKVLSRNWDTNSNSITKRYWFNQLYRSIIFSPLNIDDNQKEYSVVSEKIYNILNGNFEIEWSGDIFAFWLNENNDSPDEYEINHELDDIGINFTSMKCHIAGQQFIQKMLVPYQERDGEFVYNEILPAEDNSDIFEDDADIEFATYSNIDNSSSTVENVSNGEFDELEKPIVSYPIQDYDEYMPTEEDNQVTNIIEQPQLINDLTNTSAQMVTNELNISNIRLLLGEDLKTKEKIYWEFGNKNLNNRHLLINGNSGCGKTYCIQALLLELALQGISSVIFDYTDGFTKSKLDKTFVKTLGDKIEQRYIKIKKMPINPFKKQEIQLGDEFIPEDNVDIAMKIANIFSTVYSFGDQQRSAIYSAVLNGLKKYGENMNFEIMAQELSDIGNNYASTVLSKIRPFTDINPFTQDEDFDWKDIRDARGIIYIIQLTGYDRHIQLLLTELLLWDIWSFCVKNGDETKPFPIVLDEAQNLSHSIDSPSAKVLTEGRKFGVSGWYATQFMKPQLSDDEIQRLQQAGQKLYFSPPDEGVMTVAKNIDINAQNSKEWAEKLKKLKKGECVTCGSMERKSNFSKYEPRIIKISSIEERVNNDN